MQAEFLFDATATDLAVVPEAGGGDAARPREFLTPERWLATARLPVEPHPHQARTFLLTWEGILEGGLESGLVVKPTGTGKSVEIGLHCRYAWDVLGWRTLVWVHRKKLVDQLMGTLEFLGVNCVREQAENCGRRAIEESSMALFAREVHAVVASAQTILSPERLKFWAGFGFGLAIRDEAHHAAARGDRLIIAATRAGKGGPRLLGYTATPKRTDGTDLGEVFERVVDQMTFPEAIAIGALVTPKWVKSDVRVDLRGISTRGGDYSDAELADRVSPQLGPIAKSVVQLAGDRKTVVFVPGVKCAQMAAEAINKVVLGDGWRPGENDVARAVWGGRSDVDEVLGDFAAGRFQYICNCDLLTEGWDDRGVRCVALARKTLSAALLMQMIGRGTRRDDANGKQDCLYIDFGWQTDRNRGELVSPYRMAVPEGTSDEVIAELERVMASGDALDIAEAIRRAAEAVELRERLERAEAARKARRKAEDEERGVTVGKGGPKLRFEEFDPLAGLSGVARDDGPVVHRDLARRSRMATDKQVAFLVSLGMYERDARNLTLDEASRQIGVHSLRRKQGLCSDRQASVLQKLGVPRDEALAMKRDDARVAIDRLMIERNWKPKAARGAT